MSKFNYPFTEGEFYISLHEIKGLNYRPWGILQIMEKYKFRLFDVYKTKEQAETAAKGFGLTIVDKPE